MNDRDWEAACQARHDYLEEHSRTEEARWSLLWGMGVLPVSFLTGSHAYGKPNDNSDIDVIVLVSIEDLKGMQEVYVEQPTGTRRWTANTDYPGWNLKNGQLNLIFVTDPLDFIRWRAGTNQLVEQKPVCREDAVWMFTRLRDRTWDWIVSKWHKRIVIPESVSGK